jgi:hypothetical protein
MAAETCLVVGRKNDCTWIELRRVNVKCEGHKVDEGVWGSGCMNPGFLYFGTGWR